MTSAIDAVTAMYTQATKQLPGILEACETDEQKAEVWTEYYAIRDNFDTCVNQQFAEDDAELAQLEQGAQACAQQLAKIGDHLQNIVKVLAILSTAVRYGVKIAAKVVAV